MEKNKRMNNQIFDNNDFRCPITMLIFRDPVIASDGHVYEENAIKYWMKEKSTSPMTREHLEKKLYPCHTIKSTIQSIEILIPYLYMSMYQYDLKHWIQWFIKKNKLKIASHLLVLLEDIPDIFDESMIHIHSNCDKDKGCKKYSAIYLNCAYDNIGNLYCIKLCLNEVDNINQCKMPGRKLLYKILINNYKCVDYAYKLIERTSFDDPGLMCFLSLSAKLMINSEFKILCSTIDHTKYFKLFDYNGFQSYIRTIDSIDMFDDFLKNDMKYFDTSYHKYILHCFVGNQHLLRKVFTDKNGMINKYIEFIKKLLTNYNINIEHDPNNESILYCFIDNINNINNDEFNYDETYRDINKLKIIFNEFINFGIECFYNYNTAKIICDTFMMIHNKYTIIESENILQILLNMYDVKKNVSEILLYNFISSFFKLADHGIYLFLNWMICNSINERNSYQSSMEVAPKSIFCAYLINLNYFFTCESVSVSELKKSNHSKNIISNLNLFMKLEIDIGDEYFDLEMFAKIILFVLNDLTMDDLERFYDYFEKKNYHWDVIKCVVVRYQVIRSKENNQRYRYLLVKIINGSDIKKKYLINGIEFTIISGIMMNSVTNNHILELLIQKDIISVKDNYLYIFINPMISLDMLKLLPKDIKITKNILKDVSKYENTTIPLLRFLIDLL